MTVYLTIQQYFVISFGMVFTIVIFEKQLCIVIVNFYYRYNVNDFVFLHENLVDYNSISSV